MQQGEEMAAALAQDKQTPPATPEPSAPTAPTLEQVLNTGDLEHIEDLRVVCVQITVKPVLGIMDSEGDIVQMIPLNDLAIAGTKAQSFDQALQTIRGARAKLSANLEEQKAQARAELAKQPPTA